MGILTETYANWEKDKTEPEASQFRPVVEFLGYDPTPPARTLAERFLGCGAIGQRRRLSSSAAPSEVHSGKGEKTLI